MPQARHTSRRQSGGVGRQGREPVNIDSTLLLLIIPILVIQLGLLIWGIYDLTRPERKVKGDSKIVWALVIIFINIIGPIIYFLFGREEA